MKKINGSTLRMSATIAAFLIPGLALWLKSGYSYGVAVFLIAALCALPRLIRAHYSAQTLGIAALFLAMAVMWFELSAFGSGIGRWDRSAKYVLGVLCLLYAVNFPPQRKAFYWGLVLGCAGAGLTGLWQVYYLGLGRANGYTNAIQWGNVALLMATMAAIQLGIFWKEENWKHRIAVLLCVALGLEASILSASRGGWMALLVVVPIIGFFIFRYRRDFFKKFSIGLIVVAVLLAMSNVSMLSTRFQLASDEFAGYLHQSDKTQTVTSLGVRLEQYRAASEMIAEKPLFGWGARGYLDEMRKRIDEGRYAESTREFNFVHNEFVDLWVKTGIPGMLVQASLYLYILAIFWPTRRRMEAHDADTARWKEVLAVRLCGITLPMMYCIFGLSQHFFVHNSGIIIYVFFVIILWSALLGLKDARSVQA